MQKEISGFVEDNIHACLDDFSGYEDYNVTERQPLEAETIISNDAVFVELDYPVDVEAERADQTEFYEEFNINIPVKLGRMHELASRITHSEARNNNFERELFNLVAMHPDIPITHQSFSARQERWDLNEIEEEVNRLMFYNMHRVRFKGTDYSDFNLPEGDYERFSGYTALDSLEGNLPEDAPEDAYEYFNLFFDPNELPADYDYDPGMSFDEIRAIVNYHPDDYIAVNARPSSGGTLSTEMMRLPGLGIPFPIQLGHFTYDIDTMVEINLVDDEAFQGQGFIFRFALPVSIRSNEPDKTSESFTLESTPRQFEDPCDDIEGSYTIEVNDVHGPVHGAEVDFDCIQFGCSLGETRAEAGTFRLTTGLPTECSGGFISVHKEGYIPKMEQHTGEEYMRMQLKKLETFTVQMNKRLSYDLSRQEPISSDHRVIGTLDPQNHDEVAGFEFVPGEEPPEIDLVVGESAYDVTLYLIDSEGSILGGYQGEFNYNYFDSAGRSRIMFSVVRPVPTPRPLTDPQNQIKVMEYIDEGEYADAAAPRFN